jgi:hypothetical protein
MIVVIHDRPRITIEGEHFEGTLKFFEEKIFQFRSEKNVCVSGTFGGYLVDEIRSNDSGFCGHCFSFDRDKTMIANLNPSQR